MGDPEFFETPEQGFQELFACLAYFTEFYEARKKAPPKFDLISMLAHDESTKDMSPQELLGNIILLIVGGNDTTRNSISGGVLALNKYPDQYENCSRTRASSPKWCLRLSAGKRRSLIWRAPHWPILN